MSPELALLTADCIFEVPLEICISLAAPIPDIIIKMKKANNKVIDLLILIPPFKKKSYGIHINRSCIVSSSC